jgi:ElaB/YqjD/DUF883 family membrane-anchored ribosome-binding protein
MEIKATDKQIKELYDDLEKKLNNLKDKAKAEKKKIDQKMKAERQELKKRITKLKKYLVDTGVIKTEPRRKRK